MQELEKKLIELIGEKETKQFTEKILKAIKENPATAKSKIMMATKFI